MSDSGQALGPMAGSGGGPVMCCAGAACLGCGTAAPSTMLMDFTHGKWTSSQHLFVKVPEVSTDAQLMQPWISKEVQAAELVGPGKAAGCGCFPILLCPGRLQRLVQNKVHTLLW